MTHSRKFHLTVGALDLLAENAIYKVSIRVHVLRVLDSCDDTKTDTSDTM